MKPAVLLLIAFCLYPAMLRAAIGESPEQVGARYGKPTATDFVLDERVASESGLLYRKDGLDVFVYFEGGVSVLERFQKSEHVQFTQPEVDTLMEQSRHGGLWKAGDATERISHYQLAGAPGEELTGTWFHSDRTRGLLIVTSKYDAARNDVIARWKALHAQ